MAAKLDYSRLLDDEFLNRGERVRVRAVTLGSAQVLDTQWARSRAALLCALLLSLTVILTIGLYIFTTMLLVSAHQSGMHMQVLGMLGGGAAATPEAAALSSPALEAANESAEVDIEPHPSPFQVPVAMPVLSQDPPHEHEPHPHPVEEHDAHLLAMTGHHEQADADDHDGHQDGEHSHPGDVVLGDHHIEPAGDAGPTEHALLLCLPGDNKHPAAASRPAAALNLTRAQRDVVHSTAEFLAGRAQCHIVVLRNVSGEVARGEAPVRAAASNATATSIGSGPLAYFSSAGCGASSEDAVDDTAGAEYGGEVVLPTGRSLPVVLWDAAELFARSPLAAGWRELGHAATSVAHSKGSDPSLDLLELAARLQLLWRFGGVTVNLHASADQVLKTLSAFNRTDTQHVYLETTRAALVAAPQTCNAVVFELIRAVSKWEPIPDDSEEHERDGDLRVFDGVLDDYCRGRREARSAAEERASSPAPTSTSPSSTASSAEDESAESDSEESDESASEESDTDSASTSGTRPTATSSQAAKMGKLSFRMLRAGRPAATTTTPGPLPEDIRVDTTRCRRNLVAISLA